MSNKNKIYELKQSSVVFLYIYYIFLMLLGMFLAIMIACNMDSIKGKRELLINTFIASLSVSGMLCSVQYTHRLYKACIYGKIKSPNENFPHIGNFVYFLSRPLFSFVFVVVLIFAILSGMFVITGDLDYIINEKFLYLCVILSSFIGFSTGKVLDNFRVISDKNIEKIGGTHSE